MSRRDYDWSPGVHTPEWDPEQKQAIEQSLDRQMIEHVKELLCTLWKQGRITIEVRTAGDSALGAALHAVECPNTTPITLSEGQQLSGQQWLREQRSNSREF